jgi:hypothetical protein
LHVPLSIYAALSKSRVAQHDGSGELRFFERPLHGAGNMQSPCVVCQGQQGWDDYLLLHHYDRRIVLDNLRAAGAARLI